MTSKKILKALQVSISYLDTSLNALGKNQKLVRKYSWLAASELEYALFLFSITCTAETDRSAWKPESSMKTFDERLYLVSTLNLLKRAEVQFKTQQLDEAYKATWIARGYLYQVHDFYTTKLGKM